MFDPVDWPTTNKLLIAGIILYIYCLIVTPYLEKHYPKFAKFNKACYLECDRTEDDLCNAIHEQRGKNYYIGSEIPDDGRTTCVWTFWGVTHFFLHMVIGYVTNNFLYSLIPGVLFEIHEYYEYDCADAMDIVMNTTGFFVGRAIRAL